MRSNKKESGAEESGRGIRRRMRCQMFLFFQNAEVAVAKF